MKRILCSAGLAAGLFSIGAIGVNEGTAAGAGDEVVVRVVDAESGSPVGRPRCASSTPAIP